MRALFNLSAVAGAGKSNCLIYVVTRLRELAITFIILVFNITAREELIARGLLNSEVANFLLFNEGLPSLGWRFTE